MIGTLASYTGLAKKNIIRLLGLFLFFMLIFGVGQGFVTNLIGVVYPCFMSFYSIETDNQDDDRQWLTYWVIFALLALVDQANVLT